MKNAVITVGFASRRRARGSIGFEIVLALAVVVAAVVLASGVLDRLRRSARLNRFSAEIRAIAGAIKARHLTSGKWPAATLEGEVPAGVAVLLPDGIWPDATPIGGRYVWTPPAGREPGILGVTAFGGDGPLEVTRADLQKIDAVLDDGDLATGRFRTGFNDWPILRVGP